MELNVFFKSVLEQDRAPIVLCNLEHSVIYMNPAAILRYSEQGGRALLGQSLMLCHKPETCSIIRRVIEWFSDNIENNIVFESRNEVENKDVYMVALRDESGKLIGYYEKHEYRDHETAKLYDFSSAYKN